MTTAQDLVGFFDHFQDLPDPRMDRRTLHPVPEILLLTLCGMTCGCEGWEDLEEFGEAKLPLLRKHLRYEHGIPSNDTLQRFFRMLDPVAFEERFVAWVRSFQQGLSQIAIDGKTVRHSFDTASEKVETEQYYISSLPPDPHRMLHSVRSHWAIENSLRYMLDVSFSEDQARIRLGYAPRNIALIRKIVLNMLRSVQKPRQSLKRMRKMAGWDDSFFHSILQAHSS